jgi:sensor domain CHASE-containing protein
VSLRARLTLFFVAIVVLPVAVATAYGWQAVVRSSQRQVQAELQQARRSAMVAFAARAGRARLVVSGEPFILADAEARTAFAVQGAVAIENVQLHAEAERLSGTSAATRCWSSSPAGSPEASTTSTPSPATAARSSC